MAWLLDTNAWIDYLKNPASAVRERLAERKPEEILTCAVVRAELLHGALKYGLPERRRWRRASRSARTWPRSRRRVIAS